MSAMQIDPEDVTFHTPEEVITPPGQSEPVLIVRREQDGLFSTWQVWLEPDARAHAIGLCIGDGATRKLALEDAHRELQRLTTEALLAILQP